MQSEIESVFEYFLFFLNQVFRFLGVSILFFIFLIFYFIILNFATSKDNNNDDKITWLFPIPYCAYYNCKGVKSLAIPENCLIAGITKKKL